MKRWVRGKLFILTAMPFILALSVFVFASPQTIWRHDSGGSALISQEVSEADGIPVLVKNLPDWENVKSTTVFTNSLESLRTIVGERPILDDANFPPGTEAVTADYQAGKLVIIEYATPQLATNANFTFAEYLKNNDTGSSVIFRRIGNYITFVFDTPDRDAANALLDKISYGKTVQWLGEDPYFWEKYERYVAALTVGVGVSTAKWIAMCAGIALFIGSITGVLFFRYREHKKLTQTRFSDAGGMTRLNLDDLSEPILPE